MSEGSVPPSLAKLMALENLSIIENSTDIKRELVGNRTDVTARKADMTSTTPTSTDSSEDRNTSQRQPAASKTSSLTPFVAIPSDFSRGSPRNGPDQPSQTLETSPNDTITFTGPLTFHPNYASSKGIILQATEGTCFGFDVAVLGKHSSFFEGLNSLASFTPEAGADPVLQLPVCSAAIKFALDVVSAQEYGTSRTPLSEAHTMLLDGIVTVGDAYDLSCVFKALVDDLATFDRLSFARLTVALFAEDKETVRYLAGFLGMSPNEVCNPTKWWAVTLRNKRPFKWKAIEQLLEDSRNGQDELIKLFEKATQKPNFGVRCREIACPNYLKYHWDFSQYRRDVLKDHWGMIGLRYYLRKEPPRGCRDSFKGRLRSLIYLDIDNCKNCLSYKRQAGALAAVSRYP